MELGTIIMIIAVIVVVIIIIIFYFYNSSIDKTHSLTYNKNTFYTSKTPIVNSSDGKQFIYYATPTEVNEFDTITQKSKTLFKINAKGLAFYKELLVLDDKNILYTYDGNELKSYATGVVNIYDTIGGFFIEISGSTNYTNSLTPANGNYGLIQYIVK